MEAKAKSTRTLPLQSLDYLFRQKRLWLNPEYQRESVWKTSQRQLFIDSLLNEIDIPKLYFREISKESYQYEVVDGQQRLRAVFGFFADEFKLGPDSDPVDGHQTTARRFSELAIDLQMRLQATALDVVVLNSAYTNEDIEEMFLRLQNGTPLNAAEKRRAVAGNMREVVRELAGHKVFEYCAFSNGRYAYEDQVAKLLHLLLYGDITDIRPMSIRRTYETNKDITGSNTSVLRLSKAFNFLVKAFKNKANPRLKKYSLISLGLATVDLLEQYNLSSYPDEFADAYLDFELRRIENEDRPEGEQDPKLAAYTDAARADSIHELRYRDMMLKEAFLAALPDLTLKDTTRGFSDEQRHAIYISGGGLCAGCGAACELSDFHADHVIPHSAGGKTRISNGQLLCASCNLKKGSRT